MPPADTTLVPDPGPVLQPLQTTLDREGALLARLDAAVDAQLDALRANAPDAFRMAADDAADAVAELGRMQAARERQLRLAGRVLGLGDEPTLGRIINALGPAHLTQSEALAAAQHTLHERAEAVRTRCAELEFALGVAVRIGRELIRAWQAPDAAGRVYTAAGHTRAASARARLDQTG